MKHLNRNSAAHPRPQLRCSLYHFAHWIAARPPDKSPESVSDTLSPGLLGNLANCTNQLPVKLTLHRHRTFPQDSSMEINSHRISHCAQKEPLSQSANSGSRQRKQSEERRRRMKALFHSQDTLSSSSTGAWTPRSLPVSSIQTIIISSGLQWCGWGLGKAIKTKTEKTAPHLWLVG